MSRSPCSRYSRSYHRFWQRSRAVAITWGAGRSELSDRPRSKRLTRTGVALGIILGMPTDMPDSLRDLARQLLTATQAAASSEHDNSVLDVTDQLRVTVTRFAGADSFTSLLRRSLVLASVELPTLSGVAIGADGRLRGLDDIIDVRASGQRNSSTVDEAALAITTHLLRLLVTFIGLPFTVRLVRDAWPAMTLDLNQSRTEDEA